MMSKFWERNVFSAERDAATGDMTTTHVVDDWAQTQSIGLAGQLDCGARGFDYRPYLKDDGELYAHHGGVIVQKLMKEAVSEVITWCNAHPDELVVYYLTACDGESGCKQASLDLMAAMGVHTISNCSELSNLTIEDAKAMGKLVDGGTLLGLYDCVSEQYDPSVNCYGKGFACYDAWPTESTEYPWEKMTTYMDAATQQVPTTDGQLWMAQAHWQSTAGSITFGTLHNSSLLLDEQRSGMNQWVAQSIREGRFKHLNIVEVDNICDGGLDILDAIKSLSN